MTSDRFAPGDVHSLPPAVHSAMVVCAELSQELHRHCTKGGTVGVGVDCNVSPGAGQSVSRAWRDEDSEGEDEGGEDGADDVQRLERHAKQLWSLYCTVRESGC